LGKSNTGNIQWIYQFKNADYDGYVRARKETSYKRIKKFEKTINIQKNCQKNN